MITLVQSAKVAGSHSVSFATPPVPGNLIMVACAYTDATSTSLIFPTVTDTWGSAYFSGANSEINPVQFCLVAPKTILLEEFFAVAAAVSGAWTLTAATSGHTVVMDLVIAEFHTDQGPWALSFGGTGGGLTFGGNEPLRVNAYGANYPHNSLLSACVYEMASGTPAWTFDRGFTLIDNTTGAHSLALAYRVTSDSSSGTLNIGWHAGTGGCSTNMDWRLAVTAVSWDASVVLAASCGGPSSGMVGTPYSHTFPATGGVSPYTWSLASGSLPTGLILNPSTGVLTGTPSVADFYTFTLRITDSSSSPTGPNNLSPLFTGYNIGRAPTGQFAFEYNGLQYAFMTQTADGQTAGSDNKLHCLTSYGDFAAQMELDSANAPVIITSVGGGQFANSAYCLARDGTTVYIILAINPTSFLSSPTGVRVFRFNLATESWAGFTDYTSPVPVFGAGSVYCALNLVQRTAGDLILYFSGALVGGKNRVYYARFNGTTWSAPVLVSGQTSSGDDYVANSVLVDSGGITHFIFQKRPATSIGQEIWHVGMDASNIFGTPSLITSTNNGLDTSDTNWQTCCESSLIQFGSSIGMIYDDGNGIPFDSTANLTLSQGPAVLNPTWSKSIITTNQSLLVADSRANLIPQSVVLVFDDTNLIVLWAVAQHPGTGFPPPMWLYQSKALPGVLTWSTPAILSSQPGAFTNANDCTLSQVFAYQRSNGFGVITVWEGEDSPNNGDQVSAYLAFIRTADVSCSIFIDSAPDPLSINCNNPFNPVVGNAYSHTFPATGGTPSYTFAIIFGALPPGLSLNTSTGIVTGTVVSIGYYTFIIQVTDSASHTANTGICSINVSADAGCGNALPILRGTAGTFNAQALYPFTRYIKFVTTINAFMNGTEQRWPNTPPLAGFDLSYSKLLSADKALWLAFFRSVKGRLSTDLSIKLGTATYCNLTLLSDDLTVVNPSALLFDQRVDLRQVNGFPWVPPTVGAAFPTFSFGAKAEQPFSQITEFLTSVNDNAYGERFPFAWYGAGLTGFPTDNLVGWKIQFRLLTDADMQTLEDFFVSVKGMAETFSFTDPLSGTVYPHVRFAQDTLDILYSTKNQKSTTVSLIQVNV